jgi:Catalase
MGAPSTSWREDVPDGEEARHRAYAEALRASQRRNGAKTGGPSRALHAKGNAGVLGELTVRGDLPEPARAGLFATPATYRAYVRYSNGSGKTQPDTKGDVRGVAVKVVGVEGTKVIAGMEHEKTQDLLLIRTPTIPFRNADEFVAVVTAAGQSPLLLLPRVIGRLGLSRALELLPKLASGLRRPVRSLATTHYFSAAPIRCGAYAAHYALAPREREEPEPALAPSADFLRAGLAARLAKGPVVYDLRIQLYTDERKTPIEDASVEWKEEDAPFVTVATLTLPRQDLDGPRGRKIASFVEGLSFDPWHALEAHRPLGNIMRARNHAYRLSTLERHAAPEPDGSERFD